MLGPLGNVLALGIASAASPGIFALALAMLASKNHPVKRVCALFAGGALVAFVLALLGSEIGSGSLHLTNSHYNNQSVDFFLGALMLCFGAVSLFSKPDKLKAGQTASPHLAKVFALGIIINATNLDAVLLNFAAVRDVASAQLGFLRELLLIALAGFFFLSPALLPLLVYIYAPARAEKMLQPIGLAMAKYGRYLVALIFFVFGAYFVAKSGFLPF